MEFRVGRMGIDQRLDQRTDENLKRLGGLVDQRAFDQPPDL